MLSRLLCIALIALTAHPAAAELWSVDAEGTRQAENWVLAEGITDPMFATMIGVLDADYFGVVGQAELDSIVTANGGTKLPHQIFMKMSRRPAEGSPDSYVEIHLSEEVDRPIPYSLLGYNPGSIRASQRLDFLHFDVGNRTYLVRMDDEEREVAVQDAQLFVISDGFMEMDFDGWLDRLLGSKLDDMQVRAFLTFRWEGQRYSLGMGLTKKGRGKTGAFDFLADETLFPAPKELLIVGREMRNEGLRRLEEWEQSQPEARAIR
jgi:hypothetical protein